MNLRRIDARVKSLNNCIISYDEVISMSGCQCVKVNRTYFHYLIAKAGLLKIKREDYYYVVSRYLEIEKMQNLIKGYDFVSSYYLMKVIDIKYLMLLIGDIPKSKITFLKSDINTMELDATHDKIRRRYQLKKEVMDDKNIKDSKKNGRNYVLIRKK